VGDGGNRKDTALCRNFSQGMKALPTQVLARQRDKKFCMLTDSSQSYTEPSPFREILIQFHDI